MKKLYYFIFLFPFSIINAQTVDASFNAGYDTSYKQYIGEQSAPLPDGKFLSVFYDYEGDNDNNSSTYITKIIRVNTDGKIDATFTAIATPNMYGTKIYTKSDGSFITTGLLAGVFTMRRYNASATTDLSFTAPTFTNFVTSSQPYVAFSKVIFQSDNKIVIGGNFNTVNGQTIGGIVRLNANGSIDTSFAEGTGVSGLVYDVVLQNDGNYMVAGLIGSYNGTTKHSIIRINANGTLDSTFDVAYNYDQFGFFSNGFDQAIRSIVVEDDGKVIPCGSSFYVNNNRIDFMVRLNANGTRDTSFFSFYGSGASYLLKQNDGKILIKGATSFVGRINADGSTDNTFSNISTSVGGFNNLEGNMYLTSGDKIMINSNYRDLNGLTRQGFHRLNTNGSLDFTFNPSFGFNTQYYAMNGSGNGINPYINAKVLFDGKILVAGYFSSYNDVANRKFIRLNPDGQLDVNFNLDSNVSGTIAETQGSIKQQNDGKILFLNSLGATVNSTLYNNLLRFNYDGSLDTSFTLTNNYTIGVFQPLDNGKILVAGTGFPFISGNRYKILRLNNDGTIDTSFNSPLLGTKYSSFEVQDDGKILVCGEGFSTDTSIGPMHSIRRINPDGSIDAAFQLTIPFNYITHTKIQPDGKILINYGSVPKIGRINAADGSIDATFNIITAKYNTVSGDKGYIPVSVLNNGEIYLNAPNANGTFNGTANTNSIVVANANGTFLRSFGNKRGKFAMQGCDDLIFYSLFQNIDNSQRNDLIRYALSANLNVNPPSGSMSQSFTTGQTLADLILNGQNIQWYTSQSQCISASADRNSNVTDSLLPPSTPLVNGTTYYASQTVGEIESNYRLPVTVNLNLGIEAYAFNNVALFPNPAQNIITITNASTINKIEIYNTIGQNIISKKEDSKVFALDISNFTKGIYFFKLYAEKSTKTIKVVKE